MNIMMVTLPQRASPDDFPPLGILAIQNYLKKHGVVNVEFYHIDALRPSYADVIKYIEEKKPMALGISAVVSTAYAYTKRLSIDIKKRLPDTLIVVGGNLAASAELLLRKTGTDLCVLGEGERIFLNVVKRAETTRNPADFKDIPGLVLLDESSNLVNTGYERPLDKTEIYDFDWRDLEKTGAMDRYIYPIFKDGVVHHAAFSHDPRAYQSHRRGKKFVTVNAGSKGCVARCTFCHRWEKGIRYAPPDLAVERIRRLVSDYDVGFVSFGDESFGADQRWLKAFCKEIAPLDLLWRAAGMRVNRVDSDIIRMMRDAGCCIINYGMETGSADMLHLMEKKTTKEANHQAMQWTIEAGLKSVIQIVLRMPGETPETVRETTEFCIFGNTLSPQQDPTLLSLNYAQALPGTPLYEYARRIGLIGSTMDDEEKYLLNISDQDASDPRTSLNFSDYPVLTTLLWPRMISIKVKYAYVKKFGLDHYHRMVLGKNQGPMDAAGSRPGTEPMRLPGLWSLLFQRKKWVGNISLANLYPILLYRLRHFLIFLVLADSLVKYGASYTWSIAWEYVRFMLTFARKKGKFPYEYKSLRKIVKYDVGLNSGDAPQMLPLRQGR